MSVDGMVRNIPNGLTKEHRSKLTLWIQPSKTVPFALCWNTLGLK